MYLKPTTKSEVNTELAKYYNLYLFTEHINTTTSNRLSSGPELYADWN